MAELNVNPGDLVRVADAYSELAARAALISPQAAVEAQRIAETHGPMGYPAAVGIVAGLAKAEGPVMTKVDDFQTYAQRFTEHAATYTDEDGQAAQRTKSIDWPTDLPRTPGNGKDAPPGGGAVPLDSHQWKPGDKRHMPYGAGPGGLGPPNLPGSPPWVDIYDRTKDPAQVPHYFIRSDEIPGFKMRAPGELGPATVSDGHGNPDPYIELGPNSGVWVPKSDFPGAKFYPPDSSELPPYGWEEYLPHSGIFIWHGDLVPEPLQPPGSAPPQTLPAGR
ncbi:type VII secretion target [Mycobacterium xenopi]|uniref:type VII secretion target n=1 Tax=Mycobacterium xenopi TaxID=1789 RepID=UPI000A230B6E|nr:type VII secretion target [Mycobacterium xenopi]ORX13078.1 hypothetical protein AWC32_15780 [Mycobacterium xenopi]SPX94914.1 Protein of uncharacterised function (DUF2580) [Mycobacterium xenopi]